MGKGKTSPHLDHSTLIVTQTWQPGQLGKDLTEWSREQVSSSGTVWCIKQTHRWVILPTEHGTVKQLQPRNSQKWKTEHGSFIATNHHCHPQTLRGKEHQGERRNGPSTQMILIIVRAAAATATTIVSHLYFFHIQSVWNTKYSVSYNCKRLPQGTEMHSNAWKGKKEVKSSSATKSENSAAIDSWKGKTGKRARRRKRAPEWVLRKELKQTKWSEPGRVFWKTLVI